MNSRRQNFLLATCTAGSFPAPAPAEEEASAWPAPRDVYLINVSDPAARAGEADYVFVGKVEAEHGTEYGEKTTVETSTGPVVINAPATNYTITVKRNLKGKLLTDSPWPVQKTGGFSPELNKMILGGGDILPEIGERYLFLVSAQPDASLLALGENSVIPTGRGFEIINTYLDAVENQAGIPRERYTSLSEQR